MVKIVFLGGKPSLLARLEALGKGFPTLHGKLRSLGPETLDHVYVAGASLADTEHWALLRASLAQANRYYVVASEQPTSRNVVRAMRDGAYDVLTGEDPPPRWRQALTGAADAQKLWWELYGAADSEELHGIVGRSRLIRDLRESIQRIGPTMASVLVLGESGTGKELVAQAVHATSARGPFISLNCAAIPPDLMESELFGADKGAYTGATQTKPGLVEAANGGTLFLDEIGELRLSLQPKLLRFLETRKARRVGSTREQTFDVRIISATNRNLPGEVQAGRFRADLFYRLSEFDIYTPPLRARPEDIADLVQVFLVEASERFGRYFASIEPELIEKFRQHNWPGNVRELRQTIERLVLHYDGPILRASWWLPPAVHYPHPSLLPAPHSPLQPAPHASPPANAEAWASQTPASLSPAASASSTAAGSSPAAPGATSAAPDASPVAPGATPATWATPTTWATTPPASTAKPAPALPQAPQYLNKRERFDLARQLLEQSGGDLTWTAAQLGIHPTTLFRWRKAGKV